MKPWDILVYSVSNLFKRKLRTALTVLGVVIGVASIVVMISLGLGFSKSTMDEMSNYASLTAITVRTNNNLTDGKQPKYLSDELVEDLKKLPHVRYVAPVLTVTVVAKYGAYSNSWMEIEGTTLEYLGDMNIDVGQGRLPAESDDTLQLFWGNMMLQQFTKAHGGSYWETGVLPDIDPMNDSILYILDSDTYNQLQAGSSGSADEDSGQPVRPPKKYLLETCGVAAGGPDDYHSYSFSTYCDINKLIPVLKKEFKGRAIPGQPVNKSGKPYKQIYYSSLIVMCDEMNNVQEVDQTIRDMGYSTYNDTEWIKSSQRQTNMIEAMLGGIGAISLLVAAIGIANTMMMSIYERTKEIGIMKVLGCDIRNIQAMFLVEAGAIGFFGGIIGVTLSYVLSVVINIAVKNSGVFQVSGDISVIPPWLS
ncbi:MAG: ABC transporter permease, partial [Butyrivibrio sp.]|nr:ABC transporter permease [Butyrivibrio sp.]